MDGRDAAERSTEEHARRAADGPGCEGDQLRPQGAAPGERRDRRLA